MTTKNLNLLPLDGRQEGKSGKIKVRKRANKRNVGGFPLDSQYLLGQDSGGKKIKKTVGRKNLTASEGPVSVYEKKRRKETR